MNTLLQEPAQVSLSSVRQVAADAHTGIATIDGSPYIEHLDSVARALEPFGTRIQMIGMLHDILERTSATSEGLRLGGVPKDVAAAVEDLERPDDCDYLEFMHRVTIQDDPIDFDEALRVGLRQCPQRGALVKFADAVCADECLTNLPEEQRSALEHRHGAARRTLLGSVGIDAAAVILLRVNPALLAEVEATLGPEPNTDPRHRVSRNPARGVAGPPPA